MYNRLLSKTKDKRLSNITDIKAHPFFKDIQWDTLRTSGTPPFIPPIVSPDDMTFFSATEDGGEEESDDDYSFVDEQEDNYNMFKEYPFIGYTYMQENQDTTAPVLKKSTSAHQEFIAKHRQKLNMDPTDNINELKRAHRLEISKLKEELEELKSNEDLKRQILQLQDERQALHEKNQDLMQRVNQFEKEHENTIRENESYKQTIREKDNLLCKLEEKHHAICTENEELKQKVRHLNDQISQSEKIVALEKEEANKDHNSLIEDLQRQLHTSQEAERLAKQEACSKQNQIDKMEAQIESLSKAGNNTLKRSTKSLPAIPTAASAEYSPGEGRSILSAMWQRDKESLKHAQQALEASESQLAFAKKQVLKLKREIKCLQKFTFEQQQQQDLVKLTK